VRACSLATPLARHACSPAQARKAAARARRAAAARPRATRQRWLALCAAASAQPDSMASCAWKRADRGGGSGRSASCRPGLRPVAAGLLLRNTWMRGKGQADRGTGQDGSSKPVRWEWPTCMMGLHAAGAAGGVAGRGMGGIRGMRQ